MKFGQNQQEIQSYQRFPTLSHYTALVDAAHDPSRFHGFPPAWYRGCPRHFLYRSNCIIRRICQRIQFPPLVFFGSIPAPPGHTDCTGFICLGRQLKIFAVQAKLLKKPAEYVSERPDGESQTHCAKPLPFCLSLTAACRANPI